MQMDVHDLCHIFKTGHATAVFEWKQVVFGGHAILPINGRGKKYLLQALAARKTLVWWEEGPGGVVVTKCIAPTASFCVTGPTVSLDKMK